MIALEPSLSSLVREEDNGEDDEKYSYQKA